MSAIGAATVPAEDPAVLEHILEAVRTTAGLDFSGYRVPTLRRRVQNRMASLGLSSMHAYLERLRHAEDEPMRLVERLTIKVSRFYRNASAFDLLRAKVVPDLARRPAPRIWSAGCGFGEEPYTLAMLLVEAGVHGRVVATDVDPGALERAAAGVFPVESTEELPAELARRFLRPAGPGLVRVTGDIRARVSLEARDLTRSCPENAFDLVCCRNVLIYLQREWQTRALAAMARAVRPGGFLFLGEAEWPPAWLDLERMDRRSRIFRVPAVRR